MADRSPQDLTGVVPLLERLCAAVESLDARFAPPPPPPPLDIVEQLFARFGYVLTVRDLGEVTSIAAEGIERMIRTGEIEATKVAGLVRIPLREAARLIGETVPAHLADAALTAEAAS